MSDSRNFPKAAPKLSADATETLLLLVPGLIWGASFLFIAESMRAVGPFRLTFLRIAIGFVTLSLFPSARKPILRSDWKGTFWLGVFWMAFPLTMFPFAERQVSSALTGMLNGATPLFTAIVASLISRRPPSCRVLVGLSVGLVGAVLMAIPGMNAGQSSLRGIALIVAALISYGIALNIASPLQQRNGALPILWRAQFVALLLTAPLGLSEARVAPWTLWSALSLLSLGALGTAIAYFIVSVAAGRLGATRASATTFLIPGVALALGTLVRHEHVALLSVLGGCVCVAGAWLMRRAKISADAASAAVPAVLQYPIRPEDLNECDQEG